MNRNPANELSAWVTDIIENAVKPIQAELNKHREKHILYQSENVKLYEDNRRLHVLKRERDTQIRSLEDELAAVSTSLSNLSQYNTQVVHQLSAAVTLLHQHNIPHSISFSQINRTPSLNNHNLPGPPRNGSTTGTTGHRIEQVQPTYHSLPSTSSTARRIDLAALSSTRDPRNQHLNLIRPNPEKRQTSLDAPQPYSSFLSGTLILSLEPHPPQIPLSPKQPTTIIHFSPSPPPSTRLALLPHPASPSHQNQPPKEELLDSAMHHHQQRLYSVPPIASLSSQIQLTASQSPERPPSTILPSNNTLGNVSDVSLPIVQSAADSQVFSTQGTHSNPIPNHINGQPSTQTPKATIVIKQNDDIGDEGLIKPEAIIEACFDMTEQGVQCQFCRDRHEGGWEGALPVISDRSVDGLRKHIQEFHGSHLWDSLRNPASFNQP